MHNIEELHSEAMDLAEEAFFVQKKGEHSKALNLFNKALKIEQKAANLLPLAKKSEPTRSILYRSAASIAYHAGEYELADRLIANGLSGYPPNEIKDELKNLYEDINFKRHLSIQGLTMDSTQWLMSISGKATKFGGTSAEHLMGRVDVITKLFYRTVERLSKLPYRIRSGVSKEIKNKYGLYINSFVPRSFAVSFQVGYPDPQIPLFPEKEDKNQTQLEPSVIVDEMMECFEMFENDDPDSLKKRFNDENYFENFVGLAKQIAPDGENINLVGFNSLREGHEKPVALRKSRKQLVELSNINSKDNTEEESFDVTYIGLLRYASTPLNRKFGKVKLMIDSGETVIINVPIALMKDVVQPFYEEKVIIKTSKKGSSLYLEEISLDSNQSLSLDKGEM